MRAIVTRMPEPAYAPTAEEPVMQEKAASSAPASPPVKRENLWVNLGFNILAPALILSKLSGDAQLGTTMALLVALAFPLAYGAWDFRKRDKINIFSILGIVSTLLTGTISLMKLGPEYIALKEAAIPGLLFVLVLVSTWTRYPLVEKVILNDNLFDLAKLNQRIDELDVRRPFHRAMQKGSYMVAGSFALSSFLNYVLATTVVVSEPGTVAYNEELGRMTALSYPVIALPCTIVMGVALFYLIHQIQRMTGDRIETYLVEGLGGEQEPHPDQHTSGEK